MNLSRRRKDIVREEPPKNDEFYLANKPLLLVVEERNDALMAAARLLKTSFYEVRVLFEEVRLVAAILAQPDRHSLILTAHGTSRPLAVPQIIESLRREGYCQPVTCCVNGKVSPETLSAYEALSVDRVLSPPMTSRSSAYDLFVWVRERVALDKSGTTIMEV